MVFDPASLVLGLLGGGGTTQTTNVSTTASNQLAITPNSVINIGGGVASYPYSGGVTGNPSSNAQQAITPQGQQSPFAFAGQGYGGASYAASGSPKGIADYLSDPLVLIMAGAAIFLIARPKNA